VFEGNASYYYHADGLGSVTELTKSRGSVANTYFYGSFGDDSPASSETVANPFHFTARERDSETKLYYYHARYYDPLFGRFLSEDPIRSKAGNEFYLHVKNRPTVSRDALGLVAFLSGACYTSICKLN
jgi:RHS repeat-associated protein